MCRLRWLWLVANKAGHGRFLPSPTPRPTDPLPRALSVVAGPSPTLSPVVRQVHAPAGAGPPPGASARRGIGACCIAVLSGRPYRVSRRCGRRGHACSLGHRCLLGRCSSSALEHAQQVYAASVKGGKGRCCVLESGESERAGKREAASKVKREAANKGGGASEGRVRMLRLLELRTSADLVVSLDCAYR